MHGPNIRNLLTSGIVYAFAASACLAAAPTDRQLEFFETRIRPVLVEACYKCHNSSDTAEAGLAVDSRTAIREPTEHGTAIVPGDVEQSLLLKVIRHEIEGLEMPEDGARLGKRVVADFEQWVRMGAPDPRDEPPSPEELTVATSWPQTLKHRKQWWSLQPIGDPAVPAGAEWSDHPIDRFIAAKLDEHGLTPSQPATKRTLVRRLSFALLGLPPSPEQIDTFLQDNSDEAFAKLVDRLLRSNHYGERWARHWMDLVRYADSHGSEGDPTIPYAYRYRDYLIRAFNDDVPYDRLVREHLAGDLLREPRINHDLAINESQIGPAHLRFVFHGFAPTDALDEKVRFTDDQINVISKTFLGMTVSCARCHDHKFDAISQADYYAMFGILASCRPALVDVNVPEHQEMHKQRLVELKQAIHERVAEHWAKQVTQDDYLAHINIKRFAKSRLMKPWVEIAQGLDDDDDFATAWRAQVDRWRSDQQRIAADAQIENAWHWNLARAEDYSQWYPDGNGLPAQPLPAGDFAVALAGSSVISALLPASVHSRGLSTRHRAFLASPRFKLDGEYNVWLRIQGNQNSTVRYAVENYPRSGTVYPIVEVKNDNWYWRHFNVDYWQGDHIHLEIATAQDAPLQIRGGDRSWFGIREVIVRKKGLAAPPSNDREFLQPVFATALEREPDSPGALADCYRIAIVDAVTAWQSREATDAQALLLHECLTDSLLDNQVDAIPEIQSLIEEYRRLEAEIPQPTRVPGVVEADAFDQPLFERGNHRKPLELVRRRFLAAIDPTPYEASDSGRLALANDLVRPDNPLTARVMVNRIWHHLFGRGIVETPDNFGRLGSLPTHPELLDFLATRFQRDGWSIKETIRFIVTSRTWRQSATASEAAELADPNNQWLSHAHVRRLDAESLRDTLLTVVGQLDRNQYGDGFRANSDTPRRAVYVTSRRNSLDQFLAAFDAPVPFATTGRRNVTNVPAQSLTLLNDPFVMRLAEAWAARMHSVELSSSVRVRRMFVAAFGRPPSADEARTLVNYLEEISQQREARQECLDELREQIANYETTIAAVLDPVRAQLLGASNEGGEESVGLEPIAEWDFETNLRDSIGELHGESHGTAKLRDGALVLDGQGYVATTSLQQDLQAKTLEAWVQLANLQQRGGGVITVQTLDGDIFDSIVFGERTPRHWMAGSNGFVRTDDFGGSDESEALKQVVHVAIAYDADGTIRGYRNGQPYGSPIRKSGRVEFAKGKAQILFGLRHGEANEDRQLSGKIFTARLYDRALSAEEIAASAAGTGFVSGKQVLAALAPNQRETVIAQRQQLFHWQAELKQLTESSSNQDPWVLLAHALFNMKEFIYIR